jgi:hypothetical protein
LLKIFFSVVVEHFVVQVFVRDMELYDPLKKRSEIWIGFSFFLFFFFIRLNFLLRCLAFAFVLAFGLAFVCGVGVAVVVVRTVAFSLTGAGGSSAAISRTLSSVTPVRSKQTKKCKTKLI